MKNMMKYCIEEFRSSSLEIKFHKYKDASKFPFLRNEFFELICLLKIIFEKNVNFKRIFIQLIDNEMIESK